VRRLAVIGHLARDVVADGPSRIGGAPWYAGRAFRLLGGRAHIGAKCGEADRAEFLTRLASLGLPVKLVTGGETTAFSIRYDGDRREMHVGAVGEPWTPDEADAAADRAEWVHVAPLLRSDFAPETLAALGRGRRVLLDAQGLVRVPRVGPLELDAAFDPAVLEHVAILKLAEEEANALGYGVEDAAELRVPEVLYTFGAAGCAVIVGGRTEHVRARPLDRVADPTGAGDAFGAAYLAARSAGHAPASAARRATALVAGLLGARVR
jgi:sugar/nucleoside kinase (ribokinase family)